MSDVIFAYSHPYLAAIVVGGGSVGMLHASTDGHWSFYPNIGARIEASHLRQIADKLDELNQVAKPVCKPCQDGNEANCECGK